MRVARHFAVVLNILAVVLVVLVLVTLATSFYLYRLSLTLPDPRVDADSLRPAQTSVVYAADGSVLAEWHGEQDRTVVPFDQMPPHLRDAVVAIEDQRFWEHDGVDMEAIGRALRANASSGEVEQGGSTITQQLVKILFTSGERTVTRKIREALLAYELEARTDKNQVLETYLNTVYFGNGSYGCESAAENYFGKHTASLSLAECATLAGVIRSPSVTDPTNNPDAAIERRNVVLRQMQQQGYITAEEESLARREPLKLAPPRDAAQTAPYFVEYVKQDLIRRLGEKKVFEGGLRVYTSLEPELQKMAEKSAKQLGSKKDPEVGLVAIRHADGQIVAMVGGRDYARNQFNLATQGRRQPGSAFKTFVLVTALEKGVRPDQYFDASPYSVRVKDGVWKVQNYENSRTSGRVTLRAATNYSVNAVYARLIMKVGPPAVAATARKMGIETTVNPDPAIALGGLTEGVSPLEMASAYGTLATGGLHTPPTGIVRVTDDEGEVLYEPDGDASRVLDRGVAVQASLMLHDVVERGTGVDARIGPWAAGKTGTTQSYRDAWFVGWAGDISTAVWVGYPDAQVDMTNVHGIKVTGGSYPAQIWADFMRSATAERSKPVTPAQEEEQSAQVIAKVCQDSMQLANKRCPNTVEIYLSPDLAPKATCQLH